MKIAAICAFPPGNNTGMLSVDLALYSLYKRELEPEGVHLELISAEENYTLGSGDVSLSFKKISSAAELQEFDRVLIWGDFLQSRKYQMSGLANRAKRLYGEEYREHHQRWIDILRLNDFPEEMLGRVICTGGTFYTNTIDDEADEAYFSPLKKTLSLARLVQMRDPISASLVHTYTGRTDSAVGCDCAFYLKKFKGFECGSGAKAPPDSIVGYSFSRTVKSDSTAPEIMSDFVSSLQKATGASSSVNLAWLSAKGDPLRGLNDKIEAIKKCALVVTDTYHCAINAWREGIPAICIGNGTEKVAGTLSDKKKEYLYAALKLQDFYVYFESLSRPSQRAKVVEKIAAISKNHDLLGRVNFSLSEKIKKSEDRLIQSILK